jgi:hypothetical protein
MRNLSHLLFHIIVILLSAGIAMTLPVILGFAAQRFLTLWAVVESERAFLVMLEVGVAVLLVLLAHHILRSWKDRKLAHMAKRAGLSFIADARGFFTRKRIKALKEQNGAGRDLMLIGSTGCRTFVEPEGDLHEVLKNCREARIMLLDPLQEGVIARARSIPDPEVSPERFREQIIRSIDFLKGLREARKNVRLKLYRDMPWLKLAIVGDYICMQHYPAGRNVDDMPEYVFRHERGPGSLYDPLYQFFLARWRDPSVPEYELETDELVYRDRAGNEVRRERFNDIIMAAA